MSRNDYGLRFGEPKQYFGNFPDGRKAMKRGGDVMPKRNKKNFLKQQKILILDYVKHGEDGSVK